MKDVSSLDAPEHFFVQKINVFYYKKKLQEEKAALVSPYKALIVHLEERL